MYGATLPILSTALSTQHSRGDSVLLQELHDAGVTILARYVHRSSPGILGLIEASHCLDEGSHHPPSIHKQTQRSRGYNHLVLRVHTPGDGPGLRHEGSDVTIAKRAYD